jgi:hypothetical protein
MAPSQQLTDSERLGGTMRIFTLALLFELATMGGALESFTVQEKLIVADTRLAAAPPRRGWRGGYPTSRPMP